MLNRLKKNDKKGFTLVELIVVLVILAILAALLIPALTGYIDKAKEKQILAETRQLVMASQTMVDEAYGTFTMGSTTQIVIGSDATDLKSGKIALSDVAELAELSIDGSNVTATVTVGGPTEGALYGIVKKVEYTRSGKKCTYEKTSATAAGTFVMADTP